MTCAAGFGLVDNFCDVADGDGVPGTKPFYTPKVKVTFYLYRDATQPFLETLMPILFAIFTFRAAGWLFARDHPGTMDFVKKVMAALGSRDLFGASQRVAARPALSLDGGGAS